MKKNLKISSTAYRVLLLLKLLNENDYSIKELNTIFSSDKNVARSFSKVVMQKYITTLKLAGYKFTKPGLANKYKYKLIKAPVLINFTKDNLKTFVVLEDYVSSLFQEKLNKHYQSFLSKISGYLSEEQIAYLNYERKHQKSHSFFNNSKYSKYASLIRQFEKFCLEEQNIVVKYKLLPEGKDSQLILEPRSIKYDSDDVYICGYNPIAGERQLIHMDYIQEIKQLPVKSKYTSDKFSAVSFKLKGRLAKGYRLYEGEKISEIDKENGTITVIAYFDDKNFLIQRLMKYGDYCEVIYPKYVRDRIKEIIKDTLKNYE